MKFKYKADQLKISLSLCVTLCTVFNLHFLTLYKHQCHTENYIPNLGPAQQQTAVTDLIFGVFGPWHRPKQ